MSDRTGPVIMRRKEEEITQESEIEAIIHESRFCRLGLSDDNRPYVVPLCFGYQDRTVYIHGSLEGRKTDILLRNENVCLEFDADTEIVVAEDACNWGVRYRSVIGFGKASFLSDPDAKRRALGIIMGHYSDRPFRFPEKALDATAVVKIEITSMSGKRSQLT
jgi:uncharacterized protein